MRWWCREIVTLWPAMHFILTYINGKLSWSMEDNDHNHATIRMIFFSVPPMIRIPNQMIGASIGSKAILDCYIEAFPPSVTYWERSDGRILETGEKYQVGTKELGPYKVNIFFFWLFVIIISAVFSFKVISDW